ncbi:MAG TPA: hypothetical protein PKD92_05140 [Novosphingobium sp.]|nr:hypothetical protein [Novosphingobium sp.]HMP55941.1 hypothetical protein [Novosphingobium sp.]
MKSKITILAGVALCAIAPAQAQEAGSRSSASEDQAQTQAQGSAQILISDIVVSARRARCSAAM